jgi:hypothetical protein
VRFPSQICQRAFWQKLDFAQSQLKEAEDKAVEAHNLKVSMEEMLSNVRTELSDAQSQVCVHAFPKIHTVPAPIDGCVNPFLLSVSCL